MNSTKFSLDPETNDGESQGAEIQQFIGVKGTRSCRGGWSGAEGLLGDPVRSENCRSPESAADSD